MKEESCFAADAGLGLGLNSGFSETVIEFQAVKYTIHCGVPWQGDDIYERNKTSNTIH